MKTLSNSSLIYYGLFGLPLALVALPIYVYVPQFYADKFGLSLILIGSALLIARILDAFIDPAIGVWIDQRRSGSGYQHFILLGLPLLASAYLLLRHAPQPPAREVAHIEMRSFLAPFRNRQFRWLFSVFILNGIASAIPATLFLFFTNDRLALPHYAGLFLVLYFIAAALSMPLWVALAKRHGEQRAWLIGMLLAIAAFVWAYFLSSGAIAGFALICILSGFALGADLALPPALLAAVIGNANDSGKREGSYFGLWSWATKMNLALAAGIALPLLEVLGYRSGTTDAQGLHALAIGYALLPCVLKLIAAMLLWRAPLNKL
jgi:Na+/melibiose symporter-like transporter